MLRTSFTRILVPVLFAVASLPGAGAAERAFSVQVRDEKGRLQVAERTLPNLGADPAFAGKHFVVVAGESDRPVGFDADSELALRAATVYFHLEQAREWTENRAKTVRPLAVMAKGLKYPYVIRIQMDRPWSDLTHFVMDGSRHYNNSLTIPGGDALEATPTTPAVAAWNPEIWFYRSKNETLPSVGSQVGVVLNQRAFKNMLLQQLTYTDLVDLGQELALGIRPFWQAHAVSLGTSLVVTEAFVPFLQLVSSPFKTVRRVDTALIPEVIYHEFSHLLFAGRLGLFRPTALVEGYPNYFASEVAGLRDLGARTKGAAKGYAPKKGKSKQLYTVDVETGLMAATGSFAFSVLYRLREELGDEADTILYGALDFLDRSSDVSIDFPRAVLRSINRWSARPLVQNLNAQRVFDEKRL